MPGSCTVHLYRVKSYKDFKFLCRIYNFFKGEREFSSNEDFIIKYFRCGFHFQGVHCEDEINTICFENIELEVKCILYLCKVIGVEKIGESIVDEAYIKERFAKNNLTKENWNNLNSNKKYVNRDEMCYKKLTLEVYSIVCPIEF